MSRIMYPNRIGSFIKTEQNTVYQYKNYTLRIYNVANLESFAVVISKEKAIDEHLIIFRGEAKYSEVWPQKVVGGGVGYAKKEQQVALDELCGIVNDWYEKNKVRMEIS